MRDTNVTIAVVAPQEPFELFESFWEGVWSAAHELSPLGVQIQSFTTSDPVESEQAQILRDLLARDVQAIVLLPGDSHRLDSLIEQHARRNTPVVTAFHDAPASRRAAFVGPDFRLAGRLAGDLMAKMIKPKSHIVALIGRRGVTHLQERYDGFREALQASKVPLGLTTFDDPAHFANVVSGRGHKFDGLYVGSEESAGVGRILEHVRPNSRCITFDLTDSVRPFLEKGIVSAVVDSSRYYQGYISVQKAFECLQTNSTFAGWTPIPCSVLLPGHLNSAGDQSSLNGIFENLVRQRTLQIRHYKQALEIANAQVMRMAETDPVTGLLNRRKFEEALGGEIERENVAPLSLLVADIDDFGALNNLLGEAAGDQALKLVGESLRTICRAGDILGRVGADEFAMGLKGTPAEGVRALRERLESLLNDVRMPLHPDIRLSVSVGTATGSGAAPNVAQLLQQAEESAVSRKRSRGNLVWMKKTG